MFLYSTVFDITNDVTRSELKIFNKHASHVIGIGGA